MAKEIEHKYLVTNDSYKPLATESRRIVQGYISREVNGTVRVRITGNEARLTIKGRTIGDTRSEYEYEIPVADAEEMLRTLCQQPIISKTRHIVPFEGNIWEVDEFHGGLEGLTLAEIELPASTHTYTLPPFVGHNVTHDPRYYTSNIVSVRS
ncbi:MAG: CYTH domain-containing protein [Bacteroidales bacterium]|nr:CYTH domain-containing protein [Bacteroidales bacterium]